MLREPGARRSSPLLLSHETFYCWDKASNCVIYNTDIACKPSASSACLSFFSFTYVIRFHIHNLNSYKLSLSKMFLWKLTHVFLTHSLKTLQQTLPSPILTKRLVLLPVYWDTKGLVLIKQLHEINKIIAYMYARTILNVGSTLCIV